MCNEMFDWAFGDDEDDLSEVCYKQVMHEFESKIMPCATAPSLALALSGAPSTTNATALQPNPLPLTNCMLVPSSTCRFVLPKTPLWLYRITLWLYRN